MQLPRASSRSSPPRSSPGLSSGPKNPFFPSRSGGHGDEGGDERACCRSELRTLRQIPSPEPRSRRRLIAGASPHGRGGGRRVLPGGVLPAASWSGPGRRAALLLLVRQFCPTHFFRPSCGCVSWWWQGFIERSCKYREQGFYVEQFDRQLPKRDGKQWNLRHAHKSMEPMASVRGRMRKSKSKGTKFAAVKKMISKKTIKKYKDEVLDARKKDAENEKLGWNVPQVSSALFFSYNMALGPPYRVIVDTNFINFSIQNKGNEAFVPQGLPPGLGIAENQGSPPCPGVTI